MSRLVQQRCHLHADREAVARCPVCSRFYCRECITEHDGRVICTHCLIQQATHTHRHRTRPLLLLFLAASGGICLLWVLFLCLGHLLMLTPEKYHENTFEPVERLMRAMEEAP